MATFLFRNPRILVLAILLIAVAGSLAFWAIPRMEDPLLTPRAATITTLLPGAEAKRVESLVTDKIEQELLEIEEIKEMSSTSRQGVSFIVIELRDDTTDSQARLVWSQIRDKAEDARLLMPPEATKPEFERLDIKAYALILGLRWDGDDEPRYGVLRRWVKQLKDRLDAIPGTAKSDTFGDPKEEFVVSISPAAATAMNLTAESISQLIFASDSKSAAGQIRGPADDILLDVSGELDTLTQLSHLPIRLNDLGNVVELADIATIEKSIQTPLAAKVLLDEHAAVALGVFVQSSIRLDHWMAQVEPVLKQFEAELPNGISLQRVFQQSDYVDARMQNLFANLIYGAVAIFAVTVLLMGWRSATIISLALPLGSLVVLFVMYACEIPIHQISITGLIIAMGLMIDNAIVVVDKVNQHLRSGLTRQAAVQRSISMLTVPLLGSTLTTVFSFGPIALMPGPSGEFVGSIAIVAIIAVASSLALALTVIATIAALVLKQPVAGGGTIAAASGQRWWSSATVWSLQQLYRLPWIGVAAGTLLPVLGFITIPLLAEQFFPPADRQQFQLELELSGTGAIAETEHLATQVRRELLADEDIVEVAWFLGESAPPFYYNIIPDRKNTPRYGQAIVNTKPGSDTRGVIRRVQSNLDAKFPGVSILARQLEQGPPFSAPVEVRIFGPDAERLQELGDQVRLVLTQTPEVIHTRSNLAESLPKVTFEVDEQQARLVGLNHTSIAAKLNALLEGVVGGSILEDTEMLPVRVRVSDQRRADLNAIASMDLLPIHTNRSMQELDTAYPGIPLSAISKMKLTVETGAISRLNGTRMNEVQAFIRAGVLPSQVQSEFERLLAASDFVLPVGYTLAYAGAEAERNDAVGNLVVNGAILFTLMIASLVCALKSFRLTALLFMVAALAVGCSFGCLWLANLSWGFMSIVGMMGMIGIAVNDSIVVIAALQRLPAESVRDARAVSECVLGNVRHIIATSLTTVAGFTPLFLAGGEFWPPVAVCISGGVVGATLLALLFVPSMFMLLMGSRKRIAAIS
jgi:multidrug efflux pump